MSSGTCQFQFDPAKWAATHERPSPLDEHWSCERSVVEGTDFCCYHLPPEVRAAVGIDDATLCETFLEELTGGETSLEFIGATLGDVDLSHTVIKRASTEPIDLRHVHITGDFNLERATIRQPVLLDEITVEGRTNAVDAKLEEYVGVRGGTFRGRTSATKTRFGNDVDFTSATFEARTRFDQATFVGDADFYGASFDASVDFNTSEWQSECRFQRASFRNHADFLCAEFGARSDYREATFDGGTRFSRCTFRDEALFIGTTFSAEALFKKTDFGGVAYYQDTLFRDEASFTEATFEDKVKFRFAEFQGEASISYVNFENNAYFPDVEFKNYASFFESTFHRVADYRKTRFEDIARFMKAQFRDEAYFDGACFVGSGDFRHSVFDASVRFVDSEFRTKAMMQNATFADGSFVDIGTTNENLTVNLESSAIESGRIVQTTDDVVYFNFRDGRLGDVEIDVPGHNRIFDRLLIYRTEFDGFDFSNYRYTLSPEWILHRFEGSTGGVYDLESDRFALSDPEDEEKTGGDETSQEPTELGEEATGERSRIETYRDRIRNSPELEATYLKAKNGASQVGDSRAASKFFIKEMQYRRDSHLKQVLNGSESLVTRVRLLVLAVMNVFLSVTCGYGEKPRRTLAFSGLIVLGYWGLFSAVASTRPYGSELDYLLLSIQSFVSLVAGESASVLGFEASLIAATEGFVGAFMIGLFIFTLTRSIHR